MIFFGIILGLGIMGAMVYLALDKKSSFHIRLAALGALAVMILTVIICLIIILSDTSVPIDESMLIVGEPVKTKDDNENNLFTLFFSIFFLLAMFIMVAVIALREHKKTKPKF